MPSEEVGGEREIDLSLSSPSGNAGENVSAPDARATPDVDLTDRDLTEGESVRSETPTPAAPSGADLVEALRAGACGHVGRGCDDRIGAQLVRLGATRDLVVVMGELAAAQKLPGQSDHADPFPAGLLAGSRGDDSRWLASWLDAADVEAKRRAKRTVVEAANARSRAPPPPPAPGVARAVDAATPALGSRLAGVRAAIGPPKR